MTFDQFAPPLALLQTHFEQRPRGEKEEKLYRLSWFRIFEPISVEAWEAAVERWIATQRWMPKPVEMRELCYEEAARLVHERDEAEHRASLRRLAPPNPEDVRRVKEKLRRLREAMQLKPPAPSDAPPLLPERTDDDR